MSDHVRGRWLQFNVALARRGGPALTSARALFARIAPLVAQFRRKRRLRWFLFTRKPPDVRLRFFGPKPELDLAPQLRRALGGLRQAGHVRRFFPSVYEPETRRFGGPEAMSYVHAYFDADTTAWIALDRLGERGNRTSPTEILNIAVVNDLFSRTLSDPSEIWDAWSNLLQMLHVPQVAVAGSVPPIDVLDGLIGRAYSAEAAILRRYAVANRRLAIGLLRAWGQGRLRCGLRVILPLVALFHFNRHGMDSGRRAPLVRSMVAAWDPTRKLVGAEVGHPPAAQSRPRSA
jgi:thiopeptide-type bacteriocin biosynthesis protein